MSEIIFEVREDEVDGVYNAMALGYGIHTQGDSIDELRSMVRDAVNCYFDETMEAPRMTLGFTSCGSEGSGINN